MAYPNHGFAQSNFPPCLIDQGQLWGNNKECIGAPNDAIPRNIKQSSRLNIHYNSIMIDNITPRGNFRSGISEVYIGHALYSSIFLEGGEYRYELSDRKVVAEAKGSSSNISANVPLCDNDAVVGILKDKLEKAIWFKFYRSSYYRNILKQMKLEISHFGDYTSQNDSSTIRRCEALVNITFPYDEEDRNFKAFDNENQNNESEYVQTYTVQMQDDELIVAVDRFNGSD